MKSFAELTYYELLEIAPDAGNQELERAYRMAQATYGESSMATYSLYGDDELSVIRARIDEAYRVLREPTERSRYDRGLARAEALAEDEDEEEMTLDFPLDDLEAFDPRPEPLPESGGRGFTEARFAPHPEPRPERLLEIQPPVTQFEPVEEDDGTPFNGARLRRARLARGIDLDQVASVTKVTVAHLQSIEDDRYGDLPAPVYARGFVSAYARCIGLDAERVCRDYMDALRSAEARVNNRPRRRA